ncbi:alpha/beta fold hydrolase [Flavobacterium sp. SM15]|uniref:alpha/beta fold hydrolase n=1 Tax=Flavobacterium sp. SM15 TaxID=2908005 RepID=UPI001EDA5CA4|nr:alpha/beta fold hydrolase [Flavobacterium sp. SM15]MCG2612143.1 alpha/beta fold hydrolase [Flavobacterium sp. SM15]
MYKTTINAFIISLLCLNAVNAQDNSKFEYKSRPKEFENFEFRNDSIFPKRAVLQNVASKTFVSKLPYPMIFIHGLNSNSDTWNTSLNYFDSQYGYTYGGRFDFCLNADGNNATTNKNFYPTPGADIAAFESTVIDGDYYLVNFDVKVDGSFGTNVLSNQSAIAKQGVALKKAIERVLQLTGKDKVILVGHSMGGLCSREYLQNAANWQSDNKHHVAKLLTVGTPHGGSNKSDSGLGWFAGIDTSSEAIRDLKTSYYYSGDAGRFLFGGIEVNNSNNMNDHLFGTDFYNIDVNCNGTIGESVLGLNQKPIDNLIDFSNVIGRLTGGTSDGVVDEPSSNMNQYFPALTYPAKLFYFNSGFDFVENHTELPGYYYQIMQGLDEPNFKELAYEVETNKNYIGYTTIQENSSSADNDFYKFTVLANMSANITMSSIVTSVMSASILDSAGAAVGTIQNNSGSGLNFTRNLVPGTYYLKVTSTTPTNTNYQTPYQFMITTTLATQDNLLSNAKFYPNPVKNILNFENSNFNKATVFTVLGQELKSFEFGEDTNTKSIDMSTYSKGIYMIVLEKDGQQQTIKVVKE